MLFCCSYYYPHEEQGLLFRMLEYQSKWVALTLAGKILLPSKEEMLADVYKQYREMDENGIPRRNTHSLNYQVFISCYSCYHMNF
ncbi:putative FAD/NAD(P)-binding domain superfamily [Helianthus annuus]|nr:putative FAD/NAD(P)-binding domain superfamily [Helianthus annuus]